MTSTLNDAIFALILLVLIFLFLPIIFAIFFLIVDKILDPFWNWYCNGLEKIWNKIKGDINEIR